MKSSENVKEYFFLITIGVCYRLVDKSNGSDIFISITSHQLSYPSLSFLIEKHM